MSNDLYFELVAKVEMPEATFKRLKEIETDMVFKGYYNPAMRDVYAENHEWQEVNRTLREAYEYRSELESEMRVRHQMDKFGKSTKNK